MVNDGLLTLGSLFDGIGGFPFAAQIAEVKPLWAAEIEPFCVAVTKQHFPDMLHFGDVSKINGAEIPPVDIITFGSPCQDLSVAGKRAGMKHKSNGDDETTRSGLFVEAIRIIYEMREATNGQYPTFIVWENVPGAFTSHSGRDFRTVLEEITKTDIPMPTSGKWANAGMVRGGAICAAWRLLDAQYWGVAQRRKRIYLVGSFGSDCAAEILFKPDSVRRYLAPRGMQRAGTPPTSETSATFANIAEGMINEEQYAVDFGRTADRIQINAKQSVTLLAEGGGGGAKSGLYLVPQLVAGFHGQNSITAAGVEYREEQSPTLTRKKEADVIYALQGSMIGRADKNGPQGDGINEDVCFTLNTSDRHCVAYNNSSFGGYTPGVGTIRESGYKRPEENIICDLWEWIVRRLTPLECERLQGYPDGWTVLPEITDMSDEDYEFFKSAFMLNKQIKGQTVKKEPTKKQIIKWHNRLFNDSAQYKALGNSLAIPCALRVVGYIAEHVRRERTHHAK